MLAAVLSHHLHLHGIFFGRPHVVTDASAVLAARGASNRVTIEPEDFFEGVPVGATAYVLSHFIHDWDEEGA